MVQPEQTRGSRSAARYRASAIVRYGAVVVTSGVAVALGEQASHAWHLNFSFVTIYLALVVVVAWIGGLWPGVLSTITCTLLADYFWAEPAHSLLIASKDEAVSLLLFGLLGLIISLLCEQMHAARRTEQEARLLREETLALVAHELKNPLGAIYVVLSLLDSQAERGPAGDRLRALVARARRVAGGMDHLIRDLLDAAAIEAGAFSIVKAPERVEDLLAEVMEIHLDAAAQKRISLEVDASSGCPPTLCDRARVVQTLSNLVGNALKFTPEGGVVQVRADALDRDVRFSVIDSGPGIPREQLPHLFDRYWHGSRQLGTETGLGLYIAQGIIRSHGGRAIAVTSRPGEGSTFSFELARAADIEAAGDHATR